MKNYKCIIFDCDGVLVDSETLSSQVIVDIANDYGANIDVAYAMENFKGGFLKDCIKQIEEIIEKSLPISFEKEYRQRSFKVFKNELKPVEGVKELLGMLTIPFCVASSGPKEKIKLNLEITKLDVFFDKNIFSCYDFGLWKPDPTVFLYAVEYMGFKPKECLVIEDSLKGVEAALNGGFDVYGYVSQDEKEELPSKATKVFYHMKELLPMISTE